MFFEPNDVAQPYFQDGRRAIKHIIEEHNAKFLVDNGQKIMAVHGAEALRIIKNLAAESNQYPWYKGMRPHENIPTIRNIKAPDGDYTVGIEYEIEFRSSQERKKIVEMAADIPYATIDSDGGGTLCEVTFPPILFSAIDANWAAYKFMQAVKDAKIGMWNSGRSVGIHVNIAKGGQSKKWINNSYVFGRSLHNMGFTQEECKKFFGRPVPYSWITLQRAWLEMKMFNSTTDVDQLAWYVQCAKTIVDILDSEEWAEGRLGKKDIVQMLNNEHTEFFKE